MIADPFALDGEWLRCALHAHTTNSDGELPPWALAAHYARAGYDALATTDHWVRTQIDGREAQGLVILPSAELNALLPGGRDGHVLAYGIRELPGELRPFASLAEACEWIAGAGGVPFLAHPWWSGASFDALEADGLAGLEVFNAGCELEIGRGGSEAHWDAALEAGRPLLALAADDSHHPGFDSDHAWTWARVQERTPAALLDALRDGAFYGSCGPRIEHVAVAADTVEVRCSPCAAITLNCGAARGAQANAGRLGMRVHADVLEREPGGLIRRARLARPGAAPYGRVRVTDEHGRHAWTNPLWLD